MIPHVVLYLVVLYSQNYSARIQGHYHESSDCFKDPKNPQKYTKKLSPHFLPKKIPELRISNPKNSIDHPHHLKSRARPFPLPLGLRLIKC